MNFWIYSSASATLLWIVLFSASILEDLKPRNPFGDEATEREIGARVTDLPCYEKAYAPNIVRWRFASYPWWRAYSFARQRVIAEDYCGDETDGISKVERLKIFSDCLEALFWEPELIHLASDRAKCVTRAIAERDEGSIETRCPGIEGKTIAVWDHLSERLSSAEIDLDIRRDVMLQILKEIEYDRP